MIMALANLIAANNTSKEINLGGGFKSPSALSQETTNAGVITDFENIISSVIGIITVVGAIFFLINFTIGAFNWITSEGDKGKLEAARNRMLHGVIGLVVIVISYSLIALLGNILGLGNILDIGKQLENITDIK